MSGELFCVPEGRDDHSPALQCRVALVTQRPKSLMGSGSLSSVGAPRCQPGVEPRRRNPGNTGNKMAKPRRGDGRWPGMESRVSGDSTVAQVTVGSSMPRVRPRRMHLGVSPLVHPSPLRGSVMDGSQSRGCAGAAPPRAGVGAALRASWRQIAGVVGNGHH